MQSNRENRPTGNASMPTRIHGAKTKAVTFESSESQRAGLKGH